jgi:hypothetical protein
MATTPLDIYEFRAALLEWHQENVGQTPAIPGGNHCKLLQTLNDGLKIARKSVF